MAATKFTEVEREKLFAQLEEAQDPVLGRTSIFGGLILNHRSPLLNMMAL